MFYIRQKIRLRLSRAACSIAQGVRFVTRVVQTRTVVFGLLLLTAMFTYGSYTGTINIFVFVDNGRITIHETYTTDTLKALEEAGIYISKYDSLQYTDSSIKGDLAEVIITRSHCVTVHYDGRTFSVPTGGETVASILRRTEFVSQIGDVIVPDPGTYTEDGMVINVYRAVSHFEYENETLPFESVTNMNSRLNEGTSIVIQEGADGSVECKYEVTTVEGVVVSRVLVETITVPPVTKITEIGSQKTVTMFDGTVLVYTRRLECTATAYTTENRVRKINALGNIARYNTIAVDRNVIPLRSKVYIVSPYGTWEYGVALCEDVGGFTGNHVDIFYDTYNECIQFGKRKCIVYVLKG